MLDADILVLESLGFVFGLGQESRQPLGKIHLLRFHARPGHLRDRVEFLLNPFAHRARGNARRGETTGSQAILFFQQRRQKM